MSNVFVEVVVNAAEAAEVGLESRDEIEEPLEEALRASGLADVTGGGGGSGTYVIDVEIASEADLNGAVAAIRVVLRRLNVPPSTVIKRHKPQESIFPVYG